MLILLVLTIASAALFKARLFLIEPALAGEITNPTVTIADPATSAETTHTFNFTTDTQLPSAGGGFRINSYTPNSNSSESGYFDYSKATIDTANSITGLTINTYDNYNGITIGTSSNIAAGTAVKLTLKTVKNPQRGGSYFFRIVGFSNLNNWTVSAGAYHPSLKGLTALVEIGATSLRGTITDNSGNAVPLATVSAWSYTDGYTSANATADINGKYSLVLPAKTYMFSIYYSQATDQSYFQPANSEVTVTAGSVTTKNEKFRAATKTIEGKVTKNSGTAVTNARVYAYNYNGLGNVNKKVNSDGTYSLLVPGGTWQIYLYADTYPADWVPVYTAESVTFADDTTAEKVTKNLTVEGLDATIIVTVKKPDGSATPDNTTWLNLVNAKNNTFYGNISGGKATIPVTGGTTYTLTGSTSEQNYAFPSVPAFSVNHDETKSIEVVLKEKKSKLKVLVYYVDNGQKVGISGASVNAWANEGVSYEWASLNNGTASDGTGTLPVAGGKTYSVSVWPAYNSGFGTLNLKPKTLTIAENAEATVEFELNKLSATLTGKVVDANSNIVTNLSGWINVSDGSTGSWSSLGASITNGTFSLKVPAKVKLTAKPWIYASDYSSPGSQDVTIDDNGSQELTFKLIANDAKIQGTVYGENDEIFTKWLSIYATKSPDNNSWQSGNFDQKTGKYSISVSEGDWTLGYWYSSNDYMGTSNSISFKRIKKGETRTHDIHLKANKAEIKAQAVNEEGKPMSGVWVTASTQPPDEKTTIEQDYIGSNGGSTDQDGNATLKVPDGTYWVGGTTWYNSTGTISPKRQQVTTKEGAPASVKLVFRKPNSKLNITVKQNGEGKAAFVSAWTKDGSLAEGGSNNDGKLSLDIVSGVKWQIRAVKQVDKDVYRSPRQTVDIAEGTKETAVDLELTKSKISLPEKVTTTFNPKNPVVIELDNKTSISIPANTVEAAGTVTFVADPLAELPEQADAKPIIGYDFKLTNDTTGQAITTFKNSVTITIPWKKEWLEEAGITNENSLTISYLDPLTNSYRVLGACAVDVDGDKVACQTDHFTKFALTTSADVIAPVVPTDISAGVVDKKVVVSWTNPKDADFKGVTIYRSEKAGDLGNSIATDQKGPSYTDGAVSQNKTYYYTLRSVDVSGNESASSNQVMVAVGKGQVTVLPNTGWPNTPGQLAAVLALIAVSGGLYYYDRKIRRKAAK